MAAVITTTALTKRYDDIVAVDGLDLQIERGEIFGLLGPNGAGKTTTINMLCTIVEPTSGRAVLNGHDVVVAPAAVRQDIGIVFQEQSLDTTLTARENLELHARLYGVPRAAWQERIPQLLQLIGLEKRADDACRTFSGGMRRRLELIRGLLHRPEVLFLDEPTIGLDPQTRATMWEYIRTIAKEHGTTVILTTHYMDEAELVCDRIGIIDNGKMIALGTPGELKGRLGGDLVRLRLDGPVPPRLHEHPFIKRVVTAEDGLVTITLADAQHNLPALIRQLPGIVSIEVRTPTLNDVFISLTGRAIRDDSPVSGGGWAEAAWRDMNQGNSR